MNPSIRFLKPDEIKVVCCHVGPTPARIGIGLGGAMPVRCGPCEVKLGSDLVIKCFNPQPWAFSHCISLYVCTQLW